MPLTRKIVIARKDEVKEGMVKHFQFGVHPALAIYDQGMMRAYINRCTHMGGPVESCGTVLRCRWHQAEFDPKNGTVLSGQAPAGTQLSPIEVLQDEEHYYALFTLPLDPFS